MNQIKHQNSISILCAILMLVVTQQSILGYSSPNYISYFSSTDRLAQKLKMKFGYSSGSKTLLFSNGLTQIKLYQQSVVGSYNYKNSILINFNIYNSSFALNNIYGSSDLSVISLQLQSYLLSYINNGTDNYSTPFLYYYSLIAVSDDGIYMASLSTNTFYLTQILNNNNYYAMSPYRSTWIFAFSTSNNASYFYTADFSNSTNTINISLISLIEFMPIQSFSVYYSINPKINIVSNPKYNGDIKMIVQNTIMMINYQGSLVLLLKKDGSTWTVTQQLALVLDYDYQSVYISKNGLYIVKYYYNVGQLYQFDATTANYIHTLQFSIPFTISKLIVTNDAEIFGVDLKGVYILIPSYVATKTQQSFGTVFKKTKYFGMVIASFVFGGLSIIGFCVVLISHRRLQQQKYKQNNDVTVRSTSKDRRVKIQHQF